MSCIASPRCDYSQSLIRNVSNGLGNSDALVSFPESAESRSESSPVSVYRLLHARGPWARISRPPVRARVSPESEWVLVLGAKCQVPASIYSRLVETRRGRQVPGSRRPVPLTRECRLVTHGLTTRWSRLRPAWVGSGNLATSAIRMRRRSSAGWRRTATSGWPCPSSTSPHGTGGCGPSSTLLDCSTGQWRWHLRNASVNSEWCDCVKMWTLFLTPS